MNMGPILGLDGVDTVDGGDWPSVLTAEEWVALMAPVTVEVLEPNEALTLAIEADETAAARLAQDFE